MLGTVNFGRACPTSSPSQPASGKPLASSAAIASPQRDHLTLISQKPGESFPALAARAQRGIDQLNLSATGKQTYSILLHPNGKNLVTQEFQKAPGLFSKPQGPLNAKDIRKGAVLMERATGKKIEVTGVIQAPPQQRTHVSGTYVKNANGGVSLKPTHVETGTLFQFTAKPAQK